MEEKNLDCNEMPFDAYVHVHEHRHMSRTVNTTNQKYHFISYLISHHTCHTASHLIISSRYITLHHITSHHITSHHITSHHITSHHITSHHITSNDITSHHITSNDITSHHITSYQLTYIHPIHRLNEM